MSLPFRPSDQCYQPRVNQNDLYVTPVHDNHKPVYMTSYSREEDFFPQGSGNTSHAMNPCTITSEPAYNNEMYTPLIDWVNSFNDPYCLLANSIGDFRDGIILCHLVANIACN